MRMLFFSMKFTKGAILNVWIVFIHRHSFLYLEAINMHGYSVIHRPQSFIHESFLGNDGSINKL